MMIDVLLCGNTEPEAVPDYVLGELLLRGRVQGFRRSSGWVTVGRDPIRQENRRYSGPERRRRKGSCLMCPEMSNGDCINTNCPEHRCNAKVFALK